MAKLNYENLQEAARRLRIHYLLSERAGKSSDFRYLGIRHEQEFIDLILRDKDKEALRIFHTTLDALAA